MGIDAKENLNPNDKSDEVISNKDMYFLVKGRSKKESLDTLHRKEIITFIKKSISEGKKKTEILVTLIQKYPDSPIRSHFMQYIEHHSTNMLHRRNLQLHIRRMMYEEGKNKEEIIEILNQMYPNSPIKNHFEHEVDRYAATTGHDENAIKYVSDGGEER